MHELRKNKLVYGETFKSNLDNILKLQKQAFRIITILKNTQFKRIEYVFNLILASE